jgi:hypothetical protein
MKCKLILLITFTLAGVTQAKIDLTSLPMRDDVQLTIYNSADLTLVRESRALTLDKGRNNLQFSWVDTLIDPTSLEMFPKAHADKIEIAELSYPPRVRNVGLWGIKSGVRGQVPVEISYLTSGLSWRAFYMGTLTEDEQKMGLKGYVRVANNSGEDYENAQTRLIVGEVHLTDEIAELARRRYPHGRPDQVPPVVKYAFSAGVDVEFDSRIQAEAAEAPQALMEAKEIMKEAISEYFLYTIEGTETIATGWAKRLLSFDADDIGVVHLYKYDEQMYGTAVTRFLSFKNDKDHELGKTPIPGGMLKIYRTVDEAEHLAYEGQSNFKYIPVGEDVELNLGPVADVIVRPTFMDFRTAKYTFDPNNYITGWDELRTFKIEVKNTRRTPVKVEIKRHFDTIDWDLTSEQEFEKVDVHTIKFTLTLKPGSKKDLQYVHIKHHRINLPAINKKNLAAWWRFDETSGRVAADSSGNGRDARIAEGKPVWDSTGKFGGCLNFDETYGLAVPKEVFGNIDKAITISVWVNGNPEQNNASNVILQAGVGDTGKPYLVTVETKWQDDGRVTFITGRDEADEVTYNAELEQWAGNWNHYAFVKDADKGRQRIYLNGQVVAEIEGATASMAGVDTARIGIAPDRFGDQYIGKLDDLRIYDCAMSSPEIRQLYLSNL